MKNKEADKILRNLLYVDPKRNVLSEERDYTTKPKMITDIEGVSFINMTNTEKDVITEAITGDEKQLKDMACSVCIRAFRPLINILKNKYPEMYRDEIESEIMLFILRGIQSYSRTKGASLETYLYEKITRGAHMGALKAQANAMGISVEHFRQMQLINKKEYELKTMGIETSPETLSEHMKKDSSAKNRLSATQIKNIITMRNMTANTVYLDRILTASCSKEPGTEMAVKDTIKSDFDIDKKADLYPENKTAFKKHIEKLIQAVPTEDQNVAHFIWNQIKLGRDLDVNSAVVSNPLTKIKKLYQISHPELSKEDIGKLFRRAVRRMRNAALTCEKIPEMMCM